MNCSEAGRKGGLSRSEKKRKASARNLAVAREIRALIPETEKEAAQGNLNAMQWLADAKTTLEYLEPKPTRVAPVLITQKAGE